MARKRIIRKPPAKRRGDALSPPITPPPPCDLSAYCDAIKELIDTVKAAPSGSMIVTDDDGHIKCVPPPVTNARWCWNASTGQPYWQPE